MLEPPSGNTLTGVTVCHNPPPPTDLVAHNGPISVYNIEQNTFSSCFIGCYIYIVAITMIYKMSCQYSVLSKMPIFAPFSAAELQRFKLCGRPPGASYNFSLIPVSFCSAHSAVPWWTSCVCLWSASAVSNRSPSRLLSLRQKRSLTCTRSTTGDSQERKPWHERWSWARALPSENKHKGETKSN